MASLDTLPADQRAVLQLVLQRGRSYGEIARTRGASGFHNETLVVLAVA